MSQLEVCSVRGTDFWEPALASFEYPVVITVKHKYGFSDLESKPDTVIEMNLRGLARWSGLAFRWHLADGQGSKQSEHRITKIETSNAWCGEWYCRVKISFVIL